VTGRAEGSVAEGTARWADEPGSGASTGSVPRPPETRTGRRVPTHGGDVPESGDAGDAGDAYDAPGEPTTELPANDRGTRA